MNTKLLKAIGAEQTKILYSNVAFSLLATVVIAPVLAYTFWREVHANSLVIWLVAILLVSAFRYYVLHQFKCAKQRFTESTWLILFLVGTFLAGSSWGAMVIFFSPATDLYHWFLVLFVLVGLAGGALASLSAYYFGYMLFAIHCRRRFCRKS